MDERQQQRALLEGIKGHVYDEAFIRLVHGELSDREAEELRTNADPEIRRLYELFLPPDDEAKRRFEQLVDRTFAKQSAAQPQPEVKRPVIVAQLPARRLGRILGAGLSLAAAAGLIIWFLPRGLLRPVGSQAAASPLLFYSGNYPIERNEAGSTLLGPQETDAQKAELPEGSCWKLQLGVAKPGKLPASTRAFFVRQSSVVPWPVTFEPLPNGRMGLRGGCAGLPALSLGDWELVVQSGTTLPDLDLAAACKNRPPSEATWRCDSYPIRILPPLTETP